MDLKNLKPKEEAVEIVLKHPVSGEVLLNDDDDSPMTVFVISSFSKKYKEQVFKMSRKEAIKEVFDDKAEFEDIYEFGIDFLVEMTTGFNITLNGEKTKFSKEAAKDLYNDYTWVKEQVESGLNDAVNVFTTD